MLSAAEPVDLPELDAMFDLSAVPIVLVDDQLFIVRANLAATVMLSVEPLVGHRVTEFHPPADRGPRRARYQVVVAG